MERKSVTSASDERSDHLLREGWRWSRGRRCTDIGTCREGMGASYLLETVQDRNEIANMKLFITDVHNEKVAYTFECPYLHLITGVRH